jgi:hypothetical protein
VIQHVNKLAEENGKLRARSTGAPTSCNRSSLIIAQNGRPWLSGRRRSKKREQRNLDCLSIIACARPAHRRTCCTEEGRMAYNAAMRNAGVTLWAQRQPRVVKGLTGAPTIWSSGVKLASVASGQMLTCSTGVWHGPNLSYRAVS